MFLAKQVFYLGIDDVPVRATAGIDDVDNIGPHKGEAELLCRRRRDLVVEIYLGACSQGNLCEQSPMAL